MRNRIVSIMIVIMIFIYLVISAPVAADFDLYFDESVDKCENINEIGKNSLSASISDECSILKYVDEKDFLSNDFKQRVETEEALNSYVFEREDGTRRLYLLGEDVKFETEDGAVIEKDITLKKTDKGYSTTQNNIGLSISDSFSDGVHILFGENALSIIPKEQIINCPAVLRNNAIIYSGVYGEGTEIHFIPTLSGVKQNIVLYSCKAINEFEYIVSSKTLSPFFIENFLYFAENEDSDYRFDFGSIFIYDAVGHFTSGEIEISKIDEYSWIVTIVTPMEFLESNNTVYPVTIDPTIQVLASDTSSYIEDTTIYSGKPTLNTGSWLYNHTGLVSDGYNIGRMLVRLPGLYNSNAIFANLHADQIDNASFCIYEASGSSSQRVDLFYYSGTAWTESTATWNNTSPDGYGYLFDTMYPCNTLLTTFDITDLVKGWKNNIYTASKGFMLKNYNESDGTSYKGFDASEGLTLSRRPYVVVDYTPVIIHMPKSAIDEGESIMLTATIPNGASITWMNLSNNPNISVSNSGEVTGLKASPYACVVTAVVMLNGNMYPSACSIYVKVPDGTYFIKNKSSGRYADATGYSIGDEVLRWQLHGASNQRWEIEYITNGRYSIKNQMSNLYLGVEALNSTTAITRQYSSLGDSTEWYISKTASGDYCLFAKGNLTYSYVVGADPLSNRTIANMVYTNDSDYRDEWTLERMLPTSGYEISYSPGNWTSYVQNCCNCYAYAINNQVYPGTNYLWFKQQMGYYKGAAYMFSELEEGDIFQAVSYDYDAFNEEFNSNLIFQRVGRYDTCPAGSYKVALVASENDYHWYRQDADGLWSHKRGLNPVERTDASLTPKLIIDPLIADRGEYTVFLGYYAVSPWNGYLDTSTPVYVYYQGYIIPYDGYFTSVRPLLQKDRSSLNIINFNTAMLVNPVDSCERLCD